MSFMHKTTKLAVFTALILAFLVSSTAFAIEFKKDEFSITLPSGWDEIPRDILDANQVEISHVVPTFQDHQYDNAFSLAPAGNLFEYPHIYVKVHREGRIPANQLEKLERYSPQEDLDKYKRELSDLLSNMQPGKKIYDKQHRIIWMRLDADEANKRPVSGLSGIVLTETGFIQVIGYSYRKDYHAYEAVFQSVPLSVSPAPGLVYKPRLSDKLPAVVTTMHWKYIFGDSITNIAIALAAGIIGTVVISRRKRS